MLIKVAMPYKDGKIFEHFGKAEYFKMFLVKSGKVTFSEVISTEGKSHHELIDFLLAKNVDVVIVSGIGSGAVNAFFSNNIKVFNGCSGNPDELVQAYIDGKLEYKPSLVHTCNHGN